MYKLNLETGAATGGIVVFAAEMVQADKGAWDNYQRYVNLALKAAFGCITGGTDPLVIDMDRDGIELTRVNTGAYFDTDSDGFAEHTAWVQGGDALLARDLNGNGLIDSQGELFGTATVAGFAALKALDSNNDNLINVTDATFGSLRDHCRQ